MQHELSSQHNQEFVTNVAHNACLIQRWMPETKFSFPWTGLKRIKPVLHRTMSVLILRYA